MHSINIYPVNDAIGFLNAYPLDCDLSVAALSSFYTTVACII